MQILDRENKEIILLGDTNIDILPNYLDGESLNNNLPTHSMCILKFYNLLGIQQLIETISLSNNGNKFLFIDT